MACRPMSYSSGSGHVPIWRTPVKVYDSTSSNISSCEWLKLLKYILNLEKLDNIVNIDSAFYNCKTLGTLKFSSIENKSKIDLTATFYGCSALSTITNLTSFQNISGLSNAFVNCINIYNLYFYSSNNNNNIDATSAFDGCKRLTAINYFNCFSNIVNLNYTFRNCTNLDVISLGVDPNKMPEDNIVGTFDGSYSGLYKYLPSGVDTIPTIWQKANYNKFGVPIKSIKADIVAYITENNEAKVSLLSITVYPSYALANTTAWKYSNDNFVTTSNLSNMTVGFKAVYGVKNNSMNDYIYSDTATATTLSTNIIVYRGRSKSTYKVGALEDGLLADADSIIVSGSWENDKLTKLANSLKIAGSTYSSTSNHVLKKADFSDVIFIGSISSGFTYMFEYCDSLKTVIMPSKEFFGEISLKESFRSCYSLKNVENLDKLHNINSMYRTFNNCYKLDSVKLSDKENSNSVSFYETFMYCSKLEVAYISGFNNISSLAETFYECHMLKDVKFGKTTNNNSVSLYETFYKCDLLKHADLSSFTNITSLYNTFLNCKSLENVDFAETINNNNVYLYSTFYNCMALKYVSNFDKFTNLCDFYDAFYKCNSLKEIRLGVDITTDNAKNTYWSSDSPFSNTFGNCNAIKYLPINVMTIPDKWIKYNNFVLPIDSVEINGKGMVMSPGEAIMPSFTTYPSYVVATDTIWQLSSDGFKTIISYNTGTNVDFSKYALRCGVKNPTMTDYVYSNNVQFKEIECYLNAYIAGGVKTYMPNDLSIGTLIQADSITLYGDWNDDGILAIQKSLKASWHSDYDDPTNMNTSSNNILKKVDMATVTFTENIDKGAVCLFKNCTALKRVILPNKKFSQGLRLQHAFMGCSNLESVNNLINADSLNSINRAFKGCEKLDSLSFSPKVKKASYSFSYSFCDCKNLRCIVNFESFKTCQYAKSAFDGCVSLKEIHLGFDPNKLYNDNPDETLYTFDDCNAYKYLPEGITSIPNNWKEYNNFVIPFSLNKTDPKFENGYLTLPTPIQDPSYAAMTDVVWKISNDRFATYASYSMTSTLSPRIAAENPLYEIYNSPINGDFTECMLICAAYNQAYSVKYYYEITANGAVKVLTDIDDQGSEEFTIYPNPAKNSFQISVGSQNAEVCIFNSIGNMVVKQQVFETETIDISNLPQGIYYVKVGNQVTRLTKM